MHVELSHWPHEIFLPKTVCHHFCPGLIPLPKSVGTYQAKIYESRDLKFVVVFTCHQVLANDINIGYEEITNILVKLFIPQPLLFWFFFLLCSFGLSCDQVVKWLFICNVIRCKNSTGSRFAIWDTLHNLLTVSTLPQVLRFPKKLKKLDGYSHFPSLTTPPFSPVLNAQSSKYGKSSLNFFYMRGHIRMCIIILMMDIQMPYWWHDLGMRWF